MKSAKTKAKEFFEEWEIYLNNNMKEALIILLKEHERDTRHVAIDNLLELARFEEDMFCHLTNRLDTEETVLLDETTQTVLNTEVKDV